MGNRFSLGRCDRLRRRFAAASVEQNYGNDSGPFLAIAINRQSSVKALK